MSRGIGQTQRKIITELARHHPRALSAVVLVWGIQGIAPGGPGGYGAVDSFRRALRSLEQRDLVQPQDDTGWLLTPSGQAQAGQVGRCRRVYCLACGRVG